VHGVAHGGEIDHRRDAGEVLHQHARGPTSSRARIQILLCSLRSHFYTQRNRTEMQSKHSLTRPSNFWV
jgi:hypothetical protein